MKKAIFMIVFVAISVLCFSSCQADEAPDNQNQGESVVEMTPLADVLTRAVESHKPGDPDSYIIYVAATDEFTFSPKRIIPSSLLLPVLSFTMTLRQQELHKGAVGLLPAPGKANWLPCKWQLNLPASSKKIATSRST